MKRLESLAAAIMKHEGFAPGLPAWRHNNPGNLRASPFASSTDGGFVTFFMFDIGWRALVWDLQQKCSGNNSHGLNPGSTLADLITVWAPPSDGNDTQAYIQNVCKYLTLDPTTPLGYFLI